MNVICSGMYRACSTWQYLIVLDLVIKRYRGRRIEISNVDVFDDPTSAEAVERELLSTEWTVLKVHEGHPTFTRMLNSKTSLAVYSFRDIRDVIYSLMHKRACSFQRLVVDDCMLHRIIANDEFWRAQQNVLIQRYETIVAQPDEAIKEIASHLEIQIEDVEINRLKKAYSLESNRTRMFRHANRLRMNGVNLNDPQNAEIQNPVTHLHWNHIRDGEIAGWKNVATLEEMFILKNIGGDWLKKNGYETDSDWGELQNKQHSSKEPCSNADGQNIP